MAGRSSNETLQSDWIMPPMLGGISCFAAGTSEVDVDLTKLAGSPAKSAINQGADDWNPNPMGHYLTLEADGADIYVAFAATLAALGTLSTSAVTTVTAGVPAATSTATGTIKIPNGTVMQFKLPVIGGAAQNNRDDADWGAASPCRFLGFMTATGSGTLRLWQSSP